MNNKTYKYTIEQKGTIVDISFSYNEEILNYIKALPYRKWNPENKSWSIQTTDLAKFQEKFPQKEVQENTTISKEFVDDIKTFIERYNNEHRFAQSKTYKPSGLHCVRKCVFIRAGIPEGELISVYSYSGCAATGTVRHEYIQDILLKMTEDQREKWEYIDVADYIEMKHKENKCLDIQVGNKKGAETHLIDNNLHLSFFCDGIVKYRPTGEYFLFEFKNKTSNKAKECDDFPEEHLQQVICYCMCLDLTKVLLLVENRDNCELYISPLYEVTDKQKEDMRNMLVYAEDCVNKHIVPEKSEEGLCKFCSYKEYCDKYDYEGFDPFSLISREV